MADSQGSKTALDEALQRLRDDFKDKLPQALQREFRFATRQDLDLAMRKVQSQQAMVREMQAMDRISGFLEAMESFSKIIDLFANVSEFVPFIWGPIKYLLLVASNHVDAFGKLIESYQEISRIIPMLGQYEELFKTCSPMRILIVNTYYDILKFHSQALVCFRQKTWKKLFDANWKTFRTRIQPSIDNIKKSRRLLETQANISSFREVWEFRRSQARQVQQDVHKENKKRWGKVREWLGGTENADQDHIDQRDVRSESTTSGQWLFEKPLMETWIDSRTDTSALLWLNGQPGAGKTVLASIVIDKCRGVQTWSTLHFYCKNKDTARNNVAAIASSLVLQALDKNHDLLDYLYECCSGSLHTSSKDDGKLSEEMLHTALKSLERVYIIIDGLDECHDTLCGFGKHPEAQEKRVVSFFCSLMSTADESDDDTVVASPNAASVIRCLLVSQRDAVTTSMLSRKPTIALTEHDNIEDISEYTRTMCATIQEKFDIGIDRSKRLAKSVTENAKGMFLYAKLVMTLLLDHTTFEGVEAELDESNFPKGLEQAYVRIMERVKRSNQREHDLVFLVLGLIVTAGRPLKWREVQGAVALDLEDGHVDFKRKLLVAQPRDYFGSLVEIRANGNVELVHATARIHLTDKHPNKQEQIQEHLYHQYFLERCITLLIGPGFNEGIGDTDHTIEAHLAKGQFAFLEYAIAFWQHHALQWLGYYDSSTSTESILENLSVFLDLHYKRPKSSYSVDDRIIRQIGRISHWDRNAELANAVSASEKQVARHDASSAQNELLTTSEKLANIRRIFEASTQNRKLESTVKLSIKDMYGSSIFKCPRMSCDYFYEGFDEASRRQKHVEKHERPLRCSYPSCPRADVGMGTLKELRTHLRDMHGEYVWEDDEFPSRKILQAQEEDEDAELQEKVHASKYNCSMCDATFTRKVAKEGHEASHRGERPAKCFACGLAFARRNDCRRHEATLHSDKKRFVCHGKLGDQMYGETFWGCNKDFKRGHLLAKHYITEEEDGARTACIEPLVGQVFDPTLGANDPRTGRPKGLWVCKGTFHTEDSHQDWGCESEFKTAKQLKKHWKKGKGRTDCLKLVLRGKEEAPPPKPDKAQATATSEQALVDENTHNQPQTNEFSEPWPDFQYSDNFPDMDIEEPVPSWPDDYGTMQLPPLQDNTQDYSHDPMNTDFGQDVSGTMTLPSIDDMLYGWEDTQNPTSTPHGVQEHADIADSTYT